MHAVARYCAVRRERIAEDAVLFLGENRAHIEAVCRDLEVEAQLGMGAVRFVAEVASSVNATVPEGEEPKFLAPFSVDYLSQARKLRMLGLKTLGQVALLSEEELYALFGDEGLVIFGLVRGVDERPLIPEIDSKFPEVDIDLEEGFEPALQRLFGELGGSLCRELRVMCGSHTFALRFSRGTSDWTCAARHLRLRLEQLFFDEPPQSLCLAITEVMAQEVRQLDFWHRRRAALPPMHRPRHLLRVVWDDPDSPLPERRAHLESLVDSRCQRPLCAPRPMRSAAVAELYDQWQVDEDWWTECPVRRTYYYACLRGGKQLRFFRDRHTGKLYTH